LLKEPRLGHVADAALSPHRVPACNTPGAPSIWKRAHSGGQGHKLGLHDHRLEITGYAKRLMNQTFAIFEIFEIAGILYLVVNLLLIAIVRSIERYLMRHEAQARHGFSTQRLDGSAIQHLELAHKIQMKTMSWACP
jgi:hypothetical protein